MPAAVTVSVSPNGRQLLYAANRPGERRRLWLRAIDSVDAIPIEDTAFFPSGRPTAAASRSPVIDLARGAESRFTFGPQIDLSPVWSPDSARVAFSSKSDTNRLEFQGVRTAGSRRCRPAPVVQIG